MGRVLDRDRNRLHIPSYNEGVPGDVTIAKNNGTNYGGFRFEDGWWLVALKQFSQSDDDGFNIYTFADGDTTPDVSKDNEGIAIYKTANTSPTSITRFDGVTTKKGKILIVLFEDTNTTLVHNASIIRLPLGTNFTGAAGYAWIAIWDTSLWREISRALNS